MASKFDNYSFYKGEEKNPFTGADSLSGKSFWWDLERYAFEAGDEKLSGRLSDTMLEFIRERVWQSDSGWDTTWEVGIKRATELYKKGLWSSRYISNKEATIDEAI
jgi:hypothetical protein